MDALKQKKIFIIDTNVVLFDPRSIFKFDDHEVVIPIVVIEEVDRFKREMNENGRNARTFSRLMDELRAKGALFKGVPLSNKGVLRVELGSIEKAPVGLDMSKADNQMLVLAMHLLEKNPEKKIVFVSKDINLKSSIWAQLRSRCLAL